MEKLTVAAVQASPEKAARSLRYRFDAVGHDSRPDVFTLVVHVEPERTVTSE